jgi:gliding motility-associated-like protein
MGCFSVFGQLVTNTSQSPSGLVQNVLLGPGVTVSNIQYNGASSAIGSFTANNTNLGIQSGIVMTTGTVLNNGDGPHGPNNKESSGTDNGAPGINLLTNLVDGTSTFNATILEFDFVPFSDTVSFNYVFGSEEYPEFVGSSFNDVFAFFISGPGIAGQQNIAKLPNGAAVTINNVNSGANSAYFVSNGDGNSSPFNSSPNFIQYDGFTKVLKAVSKVQCGQKYHLIIAIADAGDGIYDSGIFLEANSLSSNGELNVTQSLSYLAYNGDNEMAEGCVRSTVTVERSGNSLPALTIPITIGGTATNGVDYTIVPSSVNFSANQKIVQFSFDAIADAIIESDETIVLNFLTKDACNNDVTISLDYIIKDPIPINVTVEGGTVLCPGDNVEVRANISGGVGPFEYLWNTGEITSSIFVSPTITSIYTLRVVDNCLQTTTNATGMVTVPTYVPLSLNLLTNIIEICPYIPYDLNPSVSGGAGNYTYEWTADQEPFTLGTNAIQNVVPNTTTFYNVKVTDQCGENISGNVLYTITSPPLTLTLKEDTLICPGGNVNLWVIPTGGVPDYHYTWEHSPEIDSSIWVNPLTTTTYTVSVSDSCQTFNVQGEIIVEVVKPIADFKVNSTLMFDGLPISFQNLTTGGYSYQWDFGDGNTSIFTNPTNTFENYGEFEIRLIATNEIGCIDSIRKKIKLEEAYYVYIPNTFTPDVNRYNNFFTAVTTGIFSLHITIYNRWGELMFESNEIDFKWDGIFKGEVAKQDTYIYKVNCVSNSGKELEFNGHVNLLK